MNHIERKQYPALNEILWDISTETISEQTAFHLYEKRWRFIDQKKLTDQEKQLIQILTDKFGSGLFLPAS